VQLPASILEQLHTLILVVNRQGAVDYVSPSAKRLLGYEPETLLGEGWWDLTRKDKYERFIDRTQVMEMISSGGSLPHGFERALTAADGSVKWIWWNVSFSEEQTLVGIGHDITSRKKMEGQLREKNQELQAMNNEILQSIAYAKRIQEAVLQDPDQLKRYFQDAFVLNKPRDVVSGDFYFYWKTGNRIVLAVADCTGHGVPGAILSVICTGLLRDTVVKNGLLDPAAILHAVDQELTLFLGKEGGGASARDGMDIALCVFDQPARTVAFAGAFRPLLLIRDGSLTEYRADRFPIGFYGAVEKTFTTTHIPLQEGDRVYLSSDGYADQFGGEQGKKFTKRKFYELLQASSSMEMEEQRAYLDYAHNNWRQDTVQTDDVLVAGVKV
jgi:PAS domain S-box-containing protein